jgi:hypothetical protein
VLDVVDTVEIPKPEEVKELPGDVMKEPEEVKELPAVNDEQPEEAKGPGPALPEVDPLQDASLGDDND